MTDSSARTWLSLQLKTQRIMMIICVLIGLVIGALKIGQAYLFSELISQLLQGPEINHSYPALLRTLCVVLILKSMMLGIQYHYRFLIGQRLRAKIRHDLSEHIAQAGPIHLKKFSSGDLSTTFSEKIEALQPYLSEYYPQSFLCVLIPLMILCVVTPINWIAALILAITAPLIPIMMTLIGKKAAASRAQFTSLSHMGSYFLACIQGLSTLKLFHRAEAEIKNIQKTAHQFRIDTLQVLKIAFLSSTVLEFFSAAALALLAVFLGFSLLGELHIGPTVTFNTALFILLIAPDFYAPLRELARAYHARADAIAASLHIQALLKLPTQTKTSPSHQESTPLKQILHYSSPPTLTLQNLHYNYPDRREPVLHGLSLTIQAGEHLAITGESGSGKSTLLHCLLRFLEPTEGMITVNQTPLSHIPPEIWHQQVSWISQKTDLFPGTLRENLLIANPQASSIACEQALLSAQASTFVKHLSHGLDTRIAEQQIGLSGGQARRIAIARAFLKKASIILMDEPTASLDAKTAEKILKALKQLCQNKTCLTISHRLDTLKQADRIAVLCDGKIIAVDTFEALFKQGLLPQGVVHA